LTDEKGWWNLRVRAIVLLNRNNEADIAVHEDLDLPKIDERQSMV